MAPLFESPPELWCALRDTHGVALPSRHPVAVLLATYPALRGLNVKQLAERLSIDAIDAQLGIVFLAAETFGKAAHIPMGQSFDVVVMRQGRPAPAVQMQTFRGY